MVNKLDFFKYVDAYNKVSPNQLVNIPEWTEDPEVADNWEKTYLARYILNGHSGAGIRIIEPGEIYPPAPLYVMYKKKKHEYRVHALLLLSDVNDLTIEDMYSVFVLSF